MIGAICSALGVSRALGWLIAAAALIAALGGVYFAIHHDGEKAGAAKVTAKVEKAHVAAVADARHDERTASTVAASIADHTARADDTSTALVQSTIEDLRHALDTAPAPAGAPVPAAPVDQLRASLNAGIDRTNRAADAADALP